MFEISKISIFLKFVRNAVVMIFFLQICFFLHSMVPKTVVLHTHSKKYGFSKIFIRRSKQDFFQNILSNLRIIIFFRNFICFTHKRIEHCFFLARALKVPRISQHTQRIFLQNLIFLGTLAKFKTYNFFFVNLVFSKWKGAGDFLQQVLRIKFIFFKTVLFQTRSDLFPKFS